MEESPARRDFVEVREHKGGARLTGSTSASTVNNRPVRVAKRDNLGGLTPPLF